MPCPHRFLNYHIEDSLFPNWDFDTLIIGTFNPSWNFTNSVSATYFYGRVKNNYFWDALPLVFKQEGLRNENKEKWIAFLQNEKIGLTDLIININDAEQSNIEHNCLLKSMQDNHLAKFKEIVYNTQKIIEFIDGKKLAKVFITNMSAPKSIEKEISKIDQACKKNNIQFTRLLTPSSGARFRLPKGTKIIDGIVNEWKPKFSNE